MSKTVSFSYNIIGSAPEKEEKLERNSERESPLPSQPPPTITDNPEAQEPAQKYVWYIEDIKDKTKKSRKYVIPTCAGYLQRLGFG
jgi:hypothetical protein